MNSNSRTSKSLKNSAVAMGFYVVNLGLQFFSRKIFLDCLGTEILGLNTTAMNLLQFLNLAELGISAGVSFTLYKPLYENDQKSINEIITLQGQLYKRIAYLIIVGAAILMCFFPMIFKKIQLPLWYAYASFSVLLFSALLGYFFNYKQIILSASQQDYKILYSFKSVMLIKILVQMAAVYYLSNGYVYWLILEGGFAIIGTISLHWMTQRTFPNLRSAKIPFKNLRDRYSDLTLKIKQLFFHKIGGFALTQSSPFIIYAYTSLTLVALYGNYLVVMNGIQALFSSLFNSISAGIGNLVAENDKKKELRIFFELFSVRFFIVISLCMCSYLIIPDFISVWIGKLYILPTSTLILLLIILYINLFRNAVDSFLFAHGLYSDIWAPIIEATINIGSSILFGYFFGLNGVLLGVISSLFIVIVLWKPYYLFRNEYPGKIKLYCWIYFKHILSAIITIVLVLIIWPHIKIEKFGELISLLFNTIISIMLTATLLLTLLIIFKSDIIYFINRFYKTSNVQSKGND